MNAEAYLDYLIETSRDFEEGRTGIGVQPSELVALRAMLNAEKKQREANGSNN